MSLTGLVDAEDYVDAVYMALAAAARAQASASRNALAWNLRPTQAGQLEKGLALRSATHAPYVQVSGRMRGPPKKTGPVKKEWQVGQQQITEAADGGAQARKRMVLSC